MALKKVKGNFDRMFDKNLTDLVRGIRNNKDNEAKYIAQCMEEIKVELRQDNISVKSNAVAKLTYLQMLGYDISWAIFNIIEVMSSNKFTYKRIGYLSASQSFHADSELLMLTTNMIRKDLNAQNQYEAGLALSGLSCFISHDLARDLANDIMTLMSSTKPYLRMKAVLMMYKVFLRYPEALRPAFPKLKEKLEDPDPGVQSAAVNVVCELARKNPQNYLSLAPVFFKLMTTSTNNWMLIKIIKLFGALTPLEPRLGRKLIEPLTNLIHSTSAMSLLYECINTVIAVLISISSGMPGHTSCVHLCVQKLRILIEDSDQNLKYLGLLAMSRILKSHPKSVQAHKDLVLRCLDDKDESIRLRALGLLGGMVSKKNLPEIVSKLSSHLLVAEGTLYRDELVARLVEVCAQNNYQHVVDFEWYVVVLLDLADMETSAKHGTLIASQLLEVGARVAGVRAAAAAECARFVRGAVAGQPGPATRAVLYAAAYVLSEYCTDEATMREAARCLPRGAALAGPARARAVCVLATLKLCARLLRRWEGEGRLRDCVELLDETLAALQPLLASDDMEVQERAHNAAALLGDVRARLPPAAPAAPAAPASNGLVDTAPAVQLASGDALRDAGGDALEDALQDARGVALEEALKVTPGAGFSGGLIEELAQLFDAELRPVAPKAQRKVPVPADLDLTRWDAEAWSDSSSESEPEPDAAQFTAAPVHPPHPPPRALTSEEMEELRSARRAEQANNPHYLKGDAREEPPPVVEIALEVPLQIYAKRSDKYLVAKESSKKAKNGKPKKRKSKKDKSPASSESDEERSAAARPAVAAGGELPDGAAASDEEPAPRDPLHRALDLNLDIPLRDDELLTSRIQQYPSPDSGHLTKKPDEAAVKKDKASKHEKKDKKKDKKSKHGKGRGKERRNTVVNDEPLLGDALLVDTGEGGAGAAGATSEGGAGAAGAASEGGAAAGEGGAGSAVKTSEGGEGDEKHARGEAGAAGAAKTEKHKKAKKDGKDKDSKAKKSSKKDKRDNKVGYEEALGISTPSKEAV